MDVDAVEDPSSFISFICSVFLNNAKSRLFSFFSSSSFVSSSCSTKSGEGSRAVPMSLPAALVSLEGAVSGADGAGSLSLLLSMSMRLGSDPVRSEESSFFASWAIRVSPLGLASEAGIVLPSATTVSVAMIDDPDGEELRVRKYSVFHRLLAFIFPCCWPSGVLFLGDPVPP